MSAKPKLVITTTGTSIATNVRRDILAEPLNADEVRREVLRGIKGKDPTVISAETNSLEKIGVDRTTFVELVHTDTQDGRLCAELLQDWCRDHWGCSVHLTNVVGVDVRDPKRFRREGLRNFLKACIGLIEAHEHTHEIAFNPTGGFKSIVPYTTLVGMLYAKPIYYIFENSRELIQLPCLPINYDEEVLARVAHKLAAIEERSAIPGREFKEGLEYYSADRYQCLIEDIGGEVTLSALGMVLWERYKKDFPPKLLRSSKVPSEKRVHLAEDHGKDVLQRWARKLVQNDYVEEIANSLPFNPSAPHPLKGVRDGGIAELVLTKTDAGYGMAVRTTGRNQEETRVIGEILVRRYGL